MLYARRYCCITVRFTERRYKRRHANAAAERAERQAGAEAGAAQRQAVLRGGGALPPPAELENPGHGRGDFSEGPPSAEHDAGPAGHDAEEARQGGRRGDCLEHGE